MSIPQWALDLIEKQNCEIKQCNAIIDRLESEAQAVESIKAQNLRLTKALEARNAENDRLRKSRKEWKRQAMAKNARLTPTGDTVPAKPVFVGGCEVPIIASTATLKPLETCEEK